MGTVMSADGTPIAYTRHGGAGPTVVLVGGTLMTQFRHDPLAGLLARDFRVFNYDRRGRGASGDHPTYDVQREVDDLNAVIGLAGAPVLLFGMSSGAVLALEAVARGSAVSALALYEPPLVVDASRPPLPSQYVDQLAALLAQDDVDGALHYFLTEGMALHPKAVDALRNGPAWAAWRDVARTLPYDGMLMRDLMSGRPLSPDRWRTVDIPVLVGHGSAGEPHMIEAAGQLTSRDSFTLHTFPGQGHAVDPHALAPVLTEFFTTYHG
ncbi:alpha/beta fold hydrolase [Streptomyces sp. NPDC056362]|uniref:alpha/beta fold hydrolase n=1 Tax=unclassified Streptomyces TaxID=2593676 RepID=UPI0035E20854